MVKKIRVVEEEPEIQDLENTDFQKKVLDYLQAMDWKLWEMLKIEQARAKNEGLKVEGEEAEEPAEKPKPKKRKSKVTPIIVDEDE